MPWAKKISTQSEYLSELKTHLAKLSEAERNDILRDQEEFFREALASGRSELDVIGSLGDPRQLAKTLIAESRLAASEEFFTNRSPLLASPDTKDDPAGETSLRQQLGSIGRAFFAVLALAPFNLIFVLGPFLALVGVIMAGWIVAASFFFASLALLFWLPTNVFTLDGSIWAHVASTLLVLASIAFTASSIFLMTLFTSWIAQLSLRYLRWNLQFITDRKEA
ncbi:MAG: DUF1700 domain-containing protein [Bdellovibrionales bacterium]|nr:DUF1700 domain-containing protein [Bdellovibrionales bacterium]